MNKLNFIQRLKGSNKRGESFKLGIDKETNLPKSIENAVSGLKCNVKCAECEQDFIAAKGEVNEWHYRHSVESDCKGGQESVLHKLAKEIVCRNSQIIVPKHGKIQYSNPVAEINQDEFRPDITAQYGEEKLYIEVVVTNPVSGKKANHYISNEIKTIVLDLSSYEYKSEIELEKYIIENTSCKKILFWIKEKLPSLWNIFLIIGGLGIIIFILSKLFGNKNNMPKASLKKSYNSKS